MDPKTQFFLATLFLISAVRGQSPPAVDHHQHLFRSKPAGIATNPPPASAAALVKLLDEAGIRRAVVLSLAYQMGSPARSGADDEYEQVKAENDWTSNEIASYSSRLRGFCGVNPLRSYAAEEVIRCAAIRNLRSGVKLHFGNSDIDYDNPSHIARVREVFSVANSNRMAIAVHMRPSVNRGRGYGSSQATTFLNEILSAAPDVPVQIAHLAGAGGYDDPAIDQAIKVFVEAIAKGDTRMKHVYFDLSGVAGIGEWEEKKGLIARRVREIGLDRILYGSDGAVAGNSPREAWAAFRRLPLTEAEFQAIETNVAPYMR